jgi:hypothetical protein
LTKKNTNPVPGEPKRRAARERKPKPGNMPSLIEDLQRLQQEMREKPISSQRFCVIWHKSAFLAGRPYMYSSHADRAFVFDSPTRAAWLISRHAEVFHAASAIEIRPYCP